jgi:hypothetical protein
VSFSIAFHSYGNFNTLGIRELLLPPQKYKGIRLVVEHACMLGKRKKT